MAENTEEKKLELLGWMSEPPGVLTSSMAGVRILVPPVESRLEAAAADLTRRCGKVGRVLLLEVLLFRKVVGRRGSESTVGVAGVMMVEGTEVLD